MFWGASTDLCGGSAFLSQAVGNLSQAVGNLSQAVGFFSIVFLLHEKRDYFRNLLIFFVAGAGIEPATS